MWGNLRSSIVNAGENIQAQNLMAKIGDVVAPVTTTSTSDYKTNSNEKEGYSKDGDYYDEKEDEDDGASEELWFRDIPRAYGVFWNS